MVPHLTVNGAARKLGKNLKYAINGRVTRHPTSCRSEIANQVRILMQTAAY